MYWEVIASDFGIDPLCQEGPKISANALWHVPVAYQLQPTPDFELFEEEELFGYSASVEFRCGGHAEALSALKDGWWGHDVKTTEDWEFSGKLFLNSGHLQFCFYFPEKQMTEFQGAILASFASTRPMNLVIRFSGHLIIGDLGIAIQPELKQKWLNGDLEIGLVGKPKVSLMFGGLVQVPPFKCHRLGRMYLTVILERFES